MIVIIQLTIYPSRKPLSLCVYMYLFLTREYVGWSAQPRSFQKIAKKFVSNFFVKQNIGFTPKNFFQWDLSYVGITGIIPHIIFRVLLFPSNLWASSNICNIVTSSHSPWMFHDTYKPVFVNLPLQAPAVYIISSSDKWSIDTILRKETWIVEVLEVQTDILKLKLQDSKWTNKTREVQN